MNIDFAPNTLTVNGIIFADMFISKWRAVFNQVQFDRSIITERFTWRIQLDIRYKLLTGFAVVSFGRNNSSVAALFLLVFVFFFVVDLLVFFLLAGAWACTVPTAIAITIARRDNLIKCFFMF